jgi:hypothetical protein
MDNCYVLYNSTPLLQLIRGWAGLSAGGPAQSWTSISVVGLAHPRVGWPLRGGALSVVRPEHICYTNMMILLATIMVK